MKVRRLIATSIARDPFDDNLAACRNSEMEVDDRACSNGVCISEKCFCPDGLFRVTEEVAPSTQNCATETSSEKDHDAASIGLYGVDVNGDVHFAVYDKNHKQIGQVESFGSRLPMKMGFITAIRYDFYDRSLIINDRFEGLNDNNNNNNNILYKVSHVFDGAMLGPSRNLTYRWRRFTREGYSTFSESVLTRWTTCSTTMPKREWFAGAKR